MATKTKKSKERIAALEKHIWQGIQDGIAATDNKASIPELLDVLTRYQYQFNKRNLDFTVTGVDPGKQQENKNKKP